MEPKSQTNEELNEIIDLVNELDDVKTSCVLCLPDRKDRLRLLCSSFLSVIFHIGVYTALVYAAVTYPVIFTPSNQETLWFYPSLLIGSQHAADSENKSETRLKENSSSSDDSLKNSEPSEPDPVATQKEETQTTAQDEGISIYTRPVPPIKTVKPIVHKRQPQAPIAPKPVKTEPEQPVEDVLEEAELPKTTTSTPDPAATEAPVQPAPPPQPAVTVAKQDEPQIIKEEISVAVPIKPIFHNSSVKTAVKAPVAVPEPPKVAETRKPEQKVRAVPVIAKAVQTPKAAKKTVQAPYGKTVVKQKADAVVARKPNVFVKPAPVAALVPTLLAVPKLLATAENAVPPKNGSGNDTTRQTIKAEKDKAREKVETSTEKSPKGLFMPPLLGDLKFEITSDESIKRGVIVTVLFRDFPKARRNRTISKSEATRIRPLSPKIVTTKPNTIQAVVENAAEGVYYLRVELERQGTIQAGITIKLFESGPKARTKTVPKQTISSNETLVRILMPEGILWEDSSAFTGSMEDSDSVTRYNNDSGLVWKEYQ